MQPSVSASHMERTIQAIKERVLTRVSLQSQLHSLGEKVKLFPVNLCKFKRSTMNRRTLSSLESLTIQLSEEGRRLFPVKTLSELESWTQLTVSDFSVNIPHSL